MDKSNNVLQFTDQKSNALFQAEKFYSFGMLNVTFEFERIDAYLKYYSNAKSEIVTYDNYIDFLFLWKQTRYSEALPLIKEEMQDKFKQSYEKLIAIFQLYKVKDVIAFINNNFSKICEDHIVTLQTFNYIKDKKNGIKKAVFLEIATKQPFVWYRNIKSQINYLKSNIDIVKILFFETNLKEYIKGKYKLLFQCTLELHKHTQFDLVVKSIEDFVINHMEELEQTITQSNIFETRFVYNDFCEFLKALESPRFWEKKKKLDDYEKLLQKETRTAFLV